MKRSGFFRNGSYLFPTVIPFFGYRFRPLMRRITGYQPWYRSFAFDASDRAQR